MLLQLLTRSEPFPLKFLISTMPIIIAERPHRRYGYNRPRYYQQRRHRGGCTFCCIPIPLCC
jgi:hypothetical protein